MAATDFLTEEQLQAMMEQRFGVPEGTARSSPLDFQYQNEEYPDPITRSRLYNQREGMYSPKMQTQDPDAYYKNVQGLQDDSRPMMGILDYKGPFSKPEDRQWPYVEYEETADKPGGHSWQHNYVYDQDNPTLDTETDPMLMEALIRQKQNNLHGIPQTLGFSEEITPSGTVAEEMIDENRIPGRIQESVPNSQNWFERMMGGAKDKFSNFKMPPLGIMGIMNAIGNQFEDRQLTGDIMDESGYMYSAEALNKMNARGGYYTDPARSARRRTNRIRNMLNRQKAGKTISTKNLDILQGQADAQNIHNIQQYTGKPVSQYRMDRPPSERQFTGHGKSGMGRDPSDKMARGGRVGYGNGGLATLFTRRG